MPTQNSFYYIPKERLANLLNLPSSFDPEGYLLCHYYEQGQAEVEILLADYAVPQHVVQTPEMQAFVGKLGTRAEVQSINFSAIRKAKSLLDQVAKQFEI